VRQVRKQLDLFGQRRAGLALVLPCLLECGVPAVIVTRARLDEDRTCPVKLRRIMELFISGAFGSIVSIRPVSHLMRGVFPRLSAS
jgi:hypothetical protein